MEWLERVNQEEREKLSRGGRDESPPPKEELPESDSQQHTLLSPPPHPPLEPAREEGSRIRHRKPPLQASDFSPPPRREFPRPSSFPSQPPTPPKLLFCQFRARFLTLPPCFSQGLC